MADPARSLTLLAEINLAIASNRRQAEAFRGVTEQFLHDTRTLERRYRWYPVLACSAFIGGVVLGAVLLRC